MTYFIITNVKVDPIQSCYHSASFTNHIDIYFFLLGRAAGPLSGALGLDQGVLCVNGIECEPQDSVLTRKVNLVIHDTHTKSEVLPRIELVKSYDHHS